MSMERMIDLRVDVIHNEKYTNHVDMNWRDGRVLGTAQCNNGEDGGDELGATRDLSMI